jgi:hypothetical protein
LGPFYSTIGLDLDIKLRTIMERNRLEWNPIISSPVLGSWKSRGTIHAFGKRWFSGTGTEME